MNIIIIYIFCFVSLFAQLLAGFIAGKTISDSKIKDEDDNQKNRLTGKELTDKLSNFYKLKNVKIARLNSKKTNYYSSKYNAIKLSPSSLDETDLSNQTTCVYVTNQACFAQNHTLLYILDTALSLLSKIFLVSFIPITLIFSIINVSKQNLTYPTTVIFIALICFVFAFVYASIRFLIKTLFTKNCLKKIKTTNLFDEKDFENLKIKLFNLEKKDYMNFLYTSLAFFKLFSPDFIFASHEK